jgi:hypothetical protein
MHGEYLLDSAAAQTGQRFSGLGATFDSATCRHLAAGGWRSSAARTPAWGRCRSSWACWPPGWGCSMKR